MSKSIDLSDFEEGGKVDDYADRLTALQERLGHIQTAHIIHKRRAIIVFSCLKVHLRPPPSASCSSISCDAAAPRSCAPSRG